MRIDLKIAALTLLLAIGFPTAGSGQSGSISGTVLALPGLQNISSGQVLLYTSDGGSIGASVAITPISAGSYNFTNLADGAYILVVSSPTLNGDRYVNSKSGSSCIGARCFTGIGTPVTVANGGALTGQDFQVEPAGSISGAITDGSQPLAGQSLAILYSSSGEFITNTTAADDGLYSFPGLPPADYYVLGDSYGGFTGKLFNDINCPGGFCSKTAGVLVAVSALTKTPNINFALARGGAIGGTFLDAETGTPAPNIAVSLFDPNFPFYIPGFSIPVGNYTAIGAADGTFQIPQAVPPGSYYLKAGSLLHRVTLFDNFDCSEDCDASTGTPIQVIAGQTTNITMQLPRNPTANAPDMKGRLTVVPFTSKASKLTVVIQNVGTLPSGSFAVSLYLSSKKTLQAGAAPYKTVAVTNLDLAQKKSIRATGKLVKKKPYVIISIDSADAVFERTERNNLIAKKIG